MPADDIAKLKIDKTEKMARPGKGRRRVLAATVLLLALLAAAGLYFRGVLAPAVSVDVTTVSLLYPAQSLSLLNASGYVTPRRRATVASKITGRVTGVFFDEGLHVHTGQILATLDESDAQRALASAVADRNATQAGIADLQVQLQNAEIELRRAGELKAQGVGTQENLDNATMAANSLKAKIALTKEQVDAAVARIGEAQQNVDNCVIRAPFDGIIVSKDAQLGEMVSPISAGGGFTRTGIATLVDMNSLEIEVDVNEAYIARVLPGQPVVAILDAYPDWQIPAKVRTVIPTADRDKATVKVRVSFLKLDPRILPDMSIKVTFLGDQPKEKNGEPAPAATIPQAAVRDANGQKFVFVVKDGSLERRAVTLAGTSGSDARILAGISAGDTVVVSGPASLHDGQAIEIKK